MLYSGYFIIVNGHAAHVRWLGIGLWDIVPFYGFLTRLAAVWRRKENENARRTLTEW